MNYKTEYGFTKKELKDIIDSKLYLTINHTGKMTHVMSISTNTLCNTFCNSRACDKDSICSHCYSRKMMNMYKDLSNALMKNECLKTELLDKAYIEKLALYLVKYNGCSMFRFEAFGDLQNEMQCTNYFNIANELAKYDIICALWTKNYAVVNKALERMAKPRNLNLIISSNHMNPTDSACLEFLDKNPNFDKIFSVYDKDSADINCGARSCYTCKKCYMKNNIKLIKEKLK